MKTLLILLLLFVQASAFHVHLEWNPNPLSEQVQVYRIRSNGAFLAQTTTTNIILLLPNVQTPTPVTVSAVNDGGEGLPSAVLLIPPPRVAVERSLDLLTWAPYTTIEFRHRQIIRVRVTPRVGGTPVVDLEQTNDGGAVWLFISELPYVPRQFVRIVTPAEP